MELRDRRRKHRETLFYKILNNLIAIDRTIVDYSDKIELKLNTRLQRKKKGASERHSKQLKVLSASDSHSPLWRSTAIRTVRDWNNLPAPVAEAAELTEFKEQLWAKP